jgi:N-sulfoglucosamine sulfohydrolase
MILIVFIAYDPGYQSIKQELSTRMAKELKEQDDPRIFGNGNVFMTYEYASEATHNFYNRFMEGEPVRAGWINQADIESGDFSFPE